MDPRGLISSPDIDYDVPLDAWREYMMAARSSLRTLAELTGGISIVNTNNFSEMLRRIDAETSDYYVVGYYTSNPEPDPPASRATRDRRPRRAGSTGARFIYARPDERARRPAGRTLKRGRRGFHGVRIRAGAPVWAPLPRAHGPASRSDASG